LINLLAALLGSPLSYASFTARDLSRSEDRTVRQVWICLSEMLENDLRPERDISLTSDQVGAIQRCITLVQSGAEYRWPDHPEEGYRGAWFPCTLLIFLLGAINVVAVLVMGFHGAWVSILNLVLLALMWLCVEKGIRKATRKWTGFADFSVWPFVTRTEFETIRRAISPTEITETSG